MTIEQDYSELWDAHEKLHLEKLALQADVQRLRTALKAMHNESENYSTLLLNKVPDEVLDQIGEAFNADALFNDAIENQTSTEDIQALLALKDAALFMHSTKDECHYNNCDSSQGGLCTCGMEKLFECVERLKALAKGRGSNV